MTVALSDCELLIPQYRWSAYLCLATGIAVVIGGATLAYFGRTLEAPEFGQIGGMALTGVGFLPFRGYYNAAQRARLLNSVRQMLQRGESLSPMTTALVEKVMLEAASA